jgi:hypothetical protein
MAKPIGKHEEKQMFHHKEHPEVKKAGEDGWG